MFEGLLGIFNTIGAILSVLFIIGIIISKNGSSKISAEKKVKRMEHFSVANVPEKMNPRQKKWEAIASMFHSQNSSEWRVAVLDADAMLEDCVTEIGYQGSTFGEKLKSMDPSRVPALNAMWDVHRLRNTLAHEGSNYDLNHREVYRAYKIYENILRDFQYIS